MVNAQDILKKIESSLVDVNVQEHFDKQGVILEIKDGVALVSGLDSVMFSEIVEFENGSKGLVLDLLQDQVGVLILGSYMGIQQGQSVKGTGEVLKVGVGEEYLGRVIDALGNPVDGKGSVSAKETYPVERIAPGVITRKSVDQPLFTGIKAIDSLVPIGKGQRELLIGDRQTGKTTIALDTILNQKGNNVQCIYVAIGQKESKIARFVQTLEEHGAMSYTTVVSAPINAPAVLQYLAPYVGCALGEWFMYNNKDSLIIYDDLSKHAVAYREISLLLRRPPGREAYPGDVFYLHSRLLERAARVTPEFGGGSLTALPIIETQAGDVGAYVPTNVISITDGQIFLNGDMFNAGVRPAVDLGISVSRVGGSAQLNVTKKVSGSLKGELASYRELAAFAQFSSDLDPDTLRVIERGKRMTELLKQPANQPIPFEKQAVVLFAGTRGYMDGIEIEKVKDFEMEVYAKLDSVYVDLAEMIRKEQKLTEDIQKKMEILCQEVKEEIS